MGFNPELVSTEIDNDPFFGNAPILDLADNHVIIKLFESECLVITDEDKKF